jgi:hypothetical protein
MTAFSRQQQYFADPEIFRRAVTTEPDSRQLLFQFPQSSGHGGTGQGFEPGFSRMILAE